MFIILLSESFGFSDINPCKSVKDFFNLSLIHSPCLAFYDAQRKKQESPPLKTPIYGTLTCGQIHTTAFSQTQIGLMLQIDRYNQDNREGEIQSSNQSLILVN